jgi:hypothetical protein
MQKVLVLPERKHGKQSKDVLYIHDTLLMFRGAFDKLRLHARLVAEKVHPKWVQTFHEHRRALFDAVDDQLRGAERIARESGRASPPSADQILLVCRQGLERLFGSVG